MTRIALHVDQGPRENLEDAASAFRVVSAAPDGGETSVFLVLDGVGGKCCGEVASASAREQLAAALAAFAAVAIDRPDGNRIPPDEILTTLCNALAEANQTILQQAAQNPHMRGMATTAVCAITLAGILYIGLLSRIRGRVPALVSGPRCDRGRFGLLPAF